MSDRIMTLISVKNIIQQRLLITESLIGKTVVLNIQGNGNTMDVKDGDGNLVQSVVEQGTVFQKRIFNCKANSAIAMSNDRTKNILRAAIQAERAGKNVSYDIGKGVKEYSAHDLFNAYLNRCQFSFSVPLPSVKVDLLTDGTEIKAKVVKITSYNADKSVKGHILTLDAATISLMPPEYAAKTTFSLDEFLVDETVDPTIAAGIPAAPVTA